MSYSAFFVFLIHVKMILSFNLHCKDILKNSFEKKGNKVLLLFKFRRVEKEKLFSVAVLLAPIKEAVRTNPGAQQCCQIELAPPASNLFKRGRSK